MSTAVINGLLAELAERGITLAVDGGQLVARGRAGAMTAELAERVKRHKPELMAALSSYRPAPVAAPVEPTPRLAPADAVTAPAADAQPVELPRGWPSDVPPPDWWPEFLSIKGSIEVLAARRQVCGDPGCGFEVAVEWEAPGCPRQWSCPRCGRTADQEG